MANWRNVTLGEVCSHPQYGAIARGGSDHIGPLFIRQTDIVAGRVDWSSVPPCDLPWSEAPRYAVAKGDILVSRLGAGVGAAAIVDEARDAVFAGYLVRFRASTQIADPRFLAYQLQSRSWTDHVRGFSSGAAQPTLNAQQMAAFAFRLPPLAQQRAISAVLALFDDKIELNRRTNETLEAMARALFKSWFVDFDPVRAKAEGRPPTGMDAETAALFPSEFVETSLGPLPVGWRHIPLGEFTDLQRGTTYKSAMKGFPGPVLLGLGTIARNGGFRDDKLSTYGGDSPDKLLVFPTELFVSLKDVTQSADLLGAVARLPRHIAKGRLTQDTVKLRLREKDLFEHVVYRTLLTGEYRSYCRQHATGTTNLGLSREDFLAYPVVIATSPAMKAFNAASRQLSQRAELAMEESRTLSCLRDEMLPRLLSGELSVGALERAASDVA